MAIHHNNPKMIECHNDRRRKIPINNFQFTKTRYLMTNYVNGNHLITVIAFHLAQLESIS